MPAWEVHLKIADKLSKKYHFTDDFIIGNVLPDTMNGFMVENPSNIFHHTVTHYSEVKKLKIPRINISDFLNENRNKLNNELILGTYVHLLTDLFFNEYTMKNHIKIDNDKMVAILNDNSQNNKKLPMQIKQQDFVIFGKQILQKENIENKIALTKNTINLSKDLNYPVTKEDLLMTIDKINELISSKETLNEEYKMFNGKELTDLYNRCLEYIDEKLIQLTRDKKIVEVFEKYTNKYDMKDDDINYKYYHSYRVMEYSNYLANKLNLDKENKELASKIGLFHDIGRFEQDKLFDSFIDSKEFDHGDYGAKILKEEKLVEDIEDNKEKQQIIIKAVKNHNKYKIETGLKELELMHAKLIRDADKLDIIEMVARKKFRKKSFDYEDNTFSVREEIKQEFFGRTTITKHNKKTNSEKALSYLALVFDLNYKESAKYLYENNILDDFYDILLNKVKYKEYIELAKKHLKEMIKC